MLPAPPGRPWGTAGEDPSSSGPIDRKRGAFPSRCTQLRLPPWPIELRRRWCAVPHAQPSGTAVRIALRRGAALSLRSLHGGETESPPSLPSGITRSIGARFRSRRQWSRPRHSLLALCAQEGLEARAVPVVGLLQVAVSKLLLAVLPVDIEGAAHGSGGSLSKGVWKTVRPI